MSHRKVFRSRVLMAAVVVAGITLLGARTGAFGMFKSREQASSAVIQTDKNAYIAGETVKVSGSGFGPFETVMLQVVHEDGTTESGMGHVAFFVSASADGHVDSTWSIDPNETAGTNFVLKATAVSAGSASVSFSRVAAIATRYFGSTLKIEGSGFNPNELVSIRFAETPGQEQVTNVADSNGFVVASLKLETEAGSHPSTVQAVSSLSGLVATAALDFESDGFFSLIDNVLGADGATCAAGCKDDVPLQNDLTRMGRNDSDASLYKIFWSWNSVTSWGGTGQTGDACALFDTGGDGGKIDFAICAQVTNNPSNAGQVIQTTGSPYAFNCAPNSPNQRKTDRCANPSPINASSVAGGVQAGVFGTLGSGDLITNTDPFLTVAGDLDHENLDTTIQVNIKKFGQTGSILPEGADLANVCSYPSAGNGGNNNPFDCVVRPASGFLQIVKNAGIGATSPTFNFDVTRGTSTTILASRTVNGSGNAGSLIPLDLTTSQAGSKYNITEAQVSGWELQSVSCTNGGTADIANRKITAINIASAETTTCTFTNIRSSGTLKVIKTVVNDAGGSAIATNFSYRLFNGDSGAPRTAAAGPNGNSHTLADGTSFNVQELNGSTPLVANDTIVVGTVTYQVTYSGCSGTITAGQTSTCTITNTALKASPGGTTVLHFVIHDKLTISSLRAGAPNAASAFVTFNVYSDSTCQTLIGSEANRPIVSATAQTSTGISILNPASTPADSAAFKAVWIQAVYTGDQYNNAFTTACAAERAEVKVKDDTPRNGF